MNAYDPRLMSWNQYNHLMNELFASNGLGIVDENNWKDWAVRLMSIGNIMRHGIPDPSGFSDWKKWAEQLAGILSINKTK